MPILNEKFGFVLRDAATGLPTSGQLVELREGSNNYVLTEKATSGFYEVASIPTGKYSAFVNSVDSGSTFGVGTGQVAALGNTLNNVAVSTASEFGFQTPSVFKATLDLDLVTNKAIPLAVAADENKIISVNASGDYVLSSPSSTGFAAVFEANSASELEAALSAPIPQKTIINTKPLEGYNYFSSKSISVYGVNSIYGANIDFSCQAGIVVNFVNDATDTNTPKIKFFTSITSFGNNSKYVGAIEPLIEIRSISIVDAEINDTTGNSMVYEKLLFINVTGTKNIIQNFWDNTSAAAAPVTSIFGRVGVVVAAFADYIAGQIGFTPYSYISSIDVGGAIGEVVDKTNVNALAITTKGDAFLANPQTFTGINTFSNNIITSQLTNFGNYPTGSTAIGNVWRDGNNLKFRDAFYTKNLTYNASSSLSETTLTVDTSINSQFSLRSQAVNLTIAAPINGLNDGQKLTLRIKDNGVSSRTIAWNAVFVAIGTTLPLSTAAGKYLYVGCIYDESAAKWHVVAVSQEA